MKTFGTLKSEIRQDLFPAGEAINLVPAHDRQFIDSLIDLQTFVECLQQDNTSVFPQCSTYYNCGLTVLDAPRGNIKKVSVIDSTSEGQSDWCSEVEYVQVNPVHIKEYLHRSMQCGFCLPTGPFFGFRNQCIKGYLPVPTDEGVPPGLAALPLGYHYPQTSTDRTHGRVGHGVWAIERGKIFIAPYIQSTESVMVKWDGIKRTWTDGDLIDEDPMLAQAMLEYVRWQHADKFDKDEAEVVRAMGAYNNARTLLMHQCREENRIRGREPSYARGTPASSQGLTLYYNEQTSYTASCPDGSGSQTVTIPAGTVASSISVADANQQAHDEAVSQANARLDCQSQPSNSYVNSEVSADAVCQAGTGAPTPDGNPAQAHVVIPAGTVTSDISQADANQKAQALAQAQAAEQIHCVWWNAPQTATVACSDLPGTTFSATIAAHTYSSSVSQDDANAQALAAANNQAITNRDNSGLCNQPPGVWNEQQQVRVQYYCNPPNPARPRCLITVNVTVPAHTVKGATQSDANSHALELGAVFGNSYAMSQCAYGHCGPFNITYGQV